MKKSLRYAVLLFLVLASQTLSRQALAAEVGYNGGFYLLSDDKDYRFQFNFQVQPLYMYEYKEAALDTNGFAMARMRTVFQGHAFGPKYTYYLSIEYSDAAGKVNVRDGFVALELASFFTVTAGQFNLPINREDMYSGIGSQLVDASKLYYHFALGRDIGLQFNGNIIKPVAYYLFVTNGDGRNKSNANKAILAGTRLEYNPMGSISGFQGDQEYSENPNLSFGSTVAYDFGSASETSDFDLQSQQGLNVHEDRLVRGEADSTFTWMGYSLLGQWQFVYNNAFRTYDQGFMAQSGYFIIPKKLELAGRYSAVIPDFPFPALAQTGITSGTVNAQFGGSGVPVYEMVGGINYFFRGHKMKIQSDYSMILNDGGVRNLNNQIIRAQLTLVF